MSHVYPAAVKASHINMITSMPPGPSWPVSFVKFLVQYALKWYSPEEKSGLERTQWYQKEAQGYYHIQTTQPQTLGYSLADSPVGLLAWIYEKLKNWTDGYEWTDEEICTWVSIYWFSTSGPAASVRIYYESMRGEFIAFQSKMNFGPAVKLVSIQIYI